MRKLLNLALPLLFLISPSTNLTARPLWAVTSPQQEVQQLLEQAEQALKSQRQAEARQLYLQVIERDSNNFRALKTLGVLYLIDQQPDQAELYLQRALQLQPNDVPVLADLGAISIVRGDADKAGAYADKALSVSPNDGKANNIKGLVFCLKEQWAQAVPVLEKALKGLRDQGEDDKDTVPRCANSLAAALGQTGQWGQALEVCNSCLSKSPDYAELYLTASRACRQQKDYKQALQFATRGLERCPNFSRLYASLCLSHAGLKQREESEKAYQQLLARDPETARMVREILDKGGPIP